MLNALLSLLLSSIPTASAAEKTVDDFRLSVTTSILDLKDEFGEFQVEYKIVDRFGVAAIGGYGTFSDVQAWELGGQARFYALGDFRGGAPVGLEFTHTQGSSWRGQMLLSASHWKFGAFGGYKHAFDFGLTLEAAAGMAYQEGSIYVEQTALWAVEDYVAVGFYQSWFGPFANVQAGLSF